MPRYRIIQRASTLWTSFRGGILGCQKGVAFHAPLQHGSRRRFQFEIPLKTYQDCLCYARDRRQISITLFILRTIVSYIFPSVALNLYRSWDRPCHREKPVCRLPLHSPVRYIPRLFCVSSSRCLLLFSVISLFPLFRIPFKFRIHTVSACQQSCNEFIYHGKKIRFTFFLYTAFSRLERCCCYCISV